MVTQNTNDYIRMDIHKSGLMNLQNHINPKITFPHAEKFEDFVEHSGETRMIKKVHPRSNDNSNDNYIDGKHKLSKPNHYS